MKKTQIKELFNTIKKTKVTFIAIMLFVAMGMTLFFGITWSGESIKSSAEAYFGKGALHDLELQFVYGFDDGVLDDISAIDGVDAVEGFYEGYEFLSRNGETFEVRVMSLTSKIDIPLQTNGTLPSAEGEIALEGYFAAVHGISIGDTIVFKHDGPYAVNEIAHLVNEEPAAIAGELESYFDADGMKYLTTDTFKVTATIETAPYLSRYADMYGVSFPDSIPVNCLAYVSPESLDKTAFPGYTNLIIRSNSLRDYSYFSGEYEEKVNDLRDAVAVYTDAYSKDKSLTVSEKADEILTLIPSLAESGYADMVREYSCSISTSGYNSSMLALQMMTTIFENLRYSMAGLFVIIGLLVCFFAVSRMVYESTIQIGTKKALGFSKFEITKFYLIYAGLAAVAGTVFGSAFARFIVEPILLNAIGDVYLFDETIYVFKLLDALLFALFEIAMQMLTVYLACRRLLKKSAVKLLLGEEPPKAKTRFYEKLGAFKRLSLYFKTIVNNFFNDKRRVLSTVVGIAACTSLVVCALTLNNHIMNSFARQYDKVYSYTGILYFEPGSDTADIKSVLDENGIVYAEVYSSYISLEAPNGKHIDSNMFVSDDEKFKDFINLYDKKGKRFELTDGIFSSCSYREEFNAKPHDKLKFVDVSQNEHETEVAGFFDHYLINNLFIMNKDTYVAEFDGDYVPNTLFLNMGDCDFGELNEKFEACDGFIYLSNDYEVGKLSFDGFASIFSIIVVVYFALAVAMALLVLLNLLVMFVSEKKRELITLMINGYTVKDARRYIYLDTILLTVIGIAAGLVFGTIMSDISLEAYKNETIYFISGVDLPACAIGIAVSILLTFGMSRIALRKINKFKLTDINDK